ncbi:MAG: hypothetical protein HC929_06410 [Leptolyngbyaceae cyanobacterium SM2_5_2]|nr:hypothetical protein [Leptolyngbyaceae cyanobacterium SM2_5_2]
MPCPLFDRLLAGPKSATQNEGQPAKIQNPKSKITLPLWNDELYLELHRGCYTTHGDQKFYNRRCEDTLFQAELWATLAVLMGLRAYPRKELEIAWKQVLFNQFHDILPGSSIPEVFAETNQNWQAALEQGCQILADVLTAIAQASPLPLPPAPGAIPVLLFNSLNWSRSEVVSVPWPASLAKHTDWQVQAALGQALPMQIEASAGRAGAGHEAALLIFATEIPPVGYRLVWLVPTDTQAQDPPAPDAWILENQYLRVAIDPTTGNIASLFDCAPGRKSSALRATSCRRSKIRASIGMPGISPPITRPIP